MPNLRIVYIKNRFSWNKGSTRLKRVTQGQLHCITHFIVNLARWPSKNPTSKWSLGTTKDFISTIILEAKNLKLMTNNLFSFQGKNLTPSLWPQMTSNELCLSNPINGLDIDSTASIYQIFERAEGQVLVCDICAQEFTEPKAIKQHKREAHRYQCDQCANNFTGNEHYFIHGMFYFWNDRIRWLILKISFSERTHLSNIRETHYFHCNINSCKRPYQDAIRKEISILTNFSILTNLSTFRT